MSQVQELLENYKQVRARLRNPDNAVPDTGINLRKRQSQELFQERQAGPTQPPSEPKYQAPFIPFRLNRLTLSPILDFCAREFGITRQEIRSRQRVRRVAFPRMVAVYLGSRLTSQGMAGMGRYLKRDHTTMMYGRRVIQKMIESDAFFARRIALLEERVVADFYRPSLPAVSEPCLGSQKELQNGGQGSNEITPIPSVDQGSRSTFRDPEAGHRPPDAVG